MSPVDPNYCPTCGFELTDEQVEGRIRRYCQQCEKPIYRNPKPCAGVLVVDDRDRVLLVQRTEPPTAGAWSFPAGYLEVDEPPRQAATRDLREETNLTLTGDALQLLDTVFVRHPKGQHVLVIVYGSARSMATGTVTPGSDAADARFWDLSGLRQSDEHVEPGYDSIIRQAVDTVSQG